MKILILLLSLSLLGCSSPGEPEISSTEILWDSYGIPHIFAHDNRELFQAFGWSQMHSHGNLLLKLYGQARGRASEYWGETFLDSDKWVLTNGIPARSVDWYAQQDEEFKGYLDAFVEGVNLYAERHGDKLDPERKKALPISAVDVLGHLQKVIHFSFVANPGLVRGANRALRGGSNAWAIAPSKSESGNALLLANPHLPWRDFFLFYETQLTSPDLNAYGTTLVGLPFLAIAFNDHLGWTHTVNTFDGSDLYELKLEGQGYLWDGVERAFEKDSHLIKILQEDGTFREEELQVLRSVHGPVISSKGKRAIALRVVGLDSPHMGRTNLDMARARNLAEFENALRSLQIPIFTVMYADRDGNILHLFGGRTPRRPEGDYNWARIVPGDTSATLWSEVHSYGELPRVHNPSSGWLQNSNDPPWTTTFPTALNPDDFPSYLAPRFMHFRAQSSARLLDEDEKITFDEMVRYKHSTRMEAAERILDDLIAAARERGGDLAQRGADVLASWDRHANSDSRGAVLFRQFYVRDSVRGNLFANAWSPESPRITPNGLKDPSSAVKAFEEAVREVETAYGRLDVSWGEVHRLRRDSVDLPANGGSGGLGIFRVVSYRDQDDGKRAASSGDSYVAAIEFSDPVRARALLSYGNSSQPDSPHRTDQMELFSRQELRPVWRTRDEVEANLSARQSWPPEK